MSQASVTNPDRMPSEDMLSCIICKSELRDPVLLQCLHNACNTCLDEEASRPGCDNHITCSTCGVATDITRRTNNPLIFAKIQHVKAMREAATCGLCRQDGNDDMVSDGFCIQCQISLCVGCLTEHRKHAKQHKYVTLDDTVSLPKLLKTTPQYCKDHGAELLQACFTCERPVCVQCVRSCHKESHDVHLLNTPEAGQRLLKIKERIEHLIDPLGSSKNILEMLTKLPERLQFAYDTQLNLFKQAKKAVINAISTAFDKAVFTLKDFYETLQEKASGYVSSAELLKRRVSYVSNYGDLVTASGDTAGILSQLKTVESHLSELKDTLSHLREPVEVARLVHMQVRLPIDLDAIACSWIRPPQLCTEDPCCALDELLKYTEDVDYITKEDHEDLAKRQRQEYEMLLEQLNNTEDKQQHQQAILDEKEKSLRLLQEKLDKLKLELELRDKQQQTDISQRTQQLEKQKKAFKLQAQQLEKQQNDYKLQVQQLEKQRNDYKVQSQQFESERSDYKRQAQKLESEQKDLLQQRLSLNEKEQDMKQLHDLLPPLSFSSVSSSWQMPGRCWDVAVTGEGHVLVAAMELGLKELDVSGKELSSWQPKEADGSVRTVDVLEDGRVAVGLRSKYVVLLLRAAAAGSGWVESKRISVLQSPPRRLSVHADLLAVCEDRLNSDTNRWECGPWLALVQLSSGQELRRRKLDYDIGSVTLTARVVVTCSDDQVKLADGSEKYVVDGHSHSGETLWRHVPCNKAIHACFAESRRILYLALSLGNKVTAVNADTGRHIKDVVACSSQGQKELYAVSVDREKLKFLVVLSRDEKDVPRKLIVYPVSQAT